MAMGDERLNELRATFDGVAELYDRARPTYPPELFDDLALAPGSRVVEIGCGTGQATVPLAERGCEIVCVELGERLARLAAERLARFEQVRVANAAFETWEPGVAGFDAVVAFTSFHWLPPKARFAKPAAILREGGKLVVVNAEHVLPPVGDEFFVEVQADYEAVVPDDPATKGGAPGPPEQVTGIGEEMAASGLFRHVEERRYLWDVEYTADEYVALIGTFSAHLVLDPAVGKRLVERIHARIEPRPGGRVRKTYLALLDLGERI
jgi:SAM-dependent methyltransferase